MKNLLSFAAFFVLFLLAFSSFGQSESKYLTGSFDAKATKLPVGFKGHDFKFLREVYFLKSRTFKDEFDTTEIYQKKVNEGAALSSESQYILLVEFVPFREPLFSYDADQKKVSFGFRTESLKLYTGITVRYVDVKASQGPGKDRWSAESLAVTNSEIIRTFSIAADIEMARKIKDAQIFILFHLRNPFSHWAWPTGGGYVFRELIFSEVDDIWIVNPDNGEIYAKLSGK